MNLFNLIVIVSSVVMHAFSEIFRILKMFSSITNNCIVALRTPCISVTELIFHSLLLA